MSVGNALKHRTCSSALSLASTKRLIRVESVREISFLYTFGTKEIQPILSLHYEFS